MLSKMPIYVENVRDIWTLPKYAPKYAKNVAMCQTRYRNCKFHNFARTISRHADGISRYSVPPSAGPLVPLQITTLAPHHSVFYRPEALRATQPTVSKH